jgi:hypothetical protein
MKDFRNTKIGDFVTLADGVKTSSGFVFTRFIQGDVVSKNKSRVLVKSKNKRRPVAVNRRDFNVMATNVFMA